MKKKPIRNVKRFTIKRNEWLRGNPDEGKLLNYEGKMCCLGIYLKACGVPAEDLEDKDMPSELACEYKLPAWLATEEDELVPVVKLANKNDEAGLAPAVREKQLRELFKEQGIVVRFVK